MLIQVSKSESTSNTVLTMWLCDLESMCWDELVEWDLGYPSSGILTRSPAGFLENYSWNTSADVRNASFSNIRGRSPAGKWINAEQVTFTVNNSMSEMAYKGSYQFGADDCSYYIMTSGIPDICRSPQSGQTFKVKKSEEGRPY